MTRSLLIPALVLTALVVAVPASAQLMQPTPPTQPMPESQRPQRPMRGLFGGGFGNTSQRLILTASFGTGYDDDLLAATSGTGTETFTSVPPRSGMFGLASTSLSYSVDETHVAGNLSVNALGRYYSGESGPLVGAYNGGGDMSFKLGARTSLALTLQAGLFLQSMAIFPGYGVGGSTGIPVDPTVFADGQGTYNSLHSGVQFSQYVTSRLALTAGYQYYVNDAWSATDLGGYAVQNGRAGVSFDLAKGLALRLGYAVGDSSIGKAAGGVAPFSERTIDGGIDFNRALSISRRSSLSFGTGVSGFNDRNKALADTRYFATGHANFSYEIGRSWTASAGYQRTADLYQAFGQPVIADAVSAGLGGQIGRHLQLSSSVAILRGTVGIAATSPGYTAGNAGMNLQIGLTRELALSVGYSYYRYQFDNGVPLPPRMLPRMERQSVRVSLDVWAPLFMRARRPNAAR